MTDADLRGERAAAESPRPPRVVAFGGGHGLAASLQALRHVTPALTAVVTVADDGGSSGRLRHELGALPPGDLRMALAALADQGEWGRRWAQLAQHRFGGDGPLSGHAVGNLVITALTEQLGDPVAALDLVGRLLGTAGRVLPLATEPLEIVADVVGLDLADPGACVEVRGQVAVATTAGRVVAVRVEPPEPPACPEAVQAVLDADWVVLGPGSWFTSVIPHLLVPEMAKAIAATEAKVAVALNLSPQPGETDGFSPEAHLEVLAAHAPELELAVVIADESAVAGGDEALREAAAGFGAELVVAPVARPDGTPRHDPDRLAEVYRQICTNDGGDAAWR
ncbi:MAG TPA: uridine diphosphate-N-acetylglucosamine-binding protein YvcK [Mycobacteriales bacterium]|nr:uridine diphosphate-N-acetylglucosamine-binding protein YvcK [Mycobacteriales bacterium]